ncbi:MAG TPA: hypothetical protein VFP32_00205 [Candidatus Saccharimonadales bacterium]|nr:hypothetical protein [Candidatus Saccharimonadales bacterium]
MANNRGFRAMDPADARRIQSEGGKNSPTQFKAGDPRTRAAGRAGGKKSRRR